MFTFLYWYRAWIEYIVNKDWMIVGESFCNQKKIEDKTTDTPVIVGTKPDEYTEMVTDGVMDENYNENCCTSESEPPVDVHLNDNFLFLKTILHEIPSLIMFFLFILIYSFIHLIHLRI